MKATKILAGMSAAALAASMLTMVSASADEVSATANLNFADVEWGNDVWTGDCTTTIASDGTYTLKWTATDDDKTFAAGVPEYLSVELTDITGFADGWSMTIDSISVDGTAATLDASAVSYAWKDETNTVYQAIANNQSYVTSVGEIVAGSELTVTFTVSGTGVEAETGTEGDSSAEEGDSSAEEGDSSAEEGASDTVIYDTETNLGTAWDTNVVIVAADFANATVGDTITVNVTANADDTWSQIILKTTSDGWPVLSDTDATYDAAASSEITVTITEDMLAELQATGLAIQGYNVTVNSVVLTNTAGDSDDTDDGEATETTVTTTVSDESLLDTLDTENAAVLASDYIFNTDGNDVFLLSGSQDYFTVEGPYTEDFDTLAEYTAFTMVLSYDADTIADAINNGTWFGGCIVLNSASTDWDQTLTWTIILDENGDPQFVLYTSDETDSEGNVTYILDDERYEGYAFVDNGDGTASLTVLYTDSIFTVTGAEDEYAQIWFYDWSGDKSVIGATGLELVSLASTDEPGTTTSSEEDESSEDGDESEDESSEEDEESEDESSEEEEETDDSDADEDEDEDSSTTSTAASTSSAASTTTTTSDSNPATGAAALGGLGVLLAGAAIVVSKRK
ncbi:MAG: hypothetical protein LUI06_01910 [Ruminococcus sp.]|nr:hypothetical protein [Ruminococcus sp.]